MTSGLNVAELKHLNPLEDFPEDHFLAIIYGVRRSGKTTMLKQLVYDLYPKMQAYETHVFCSTAQFNTTSYDWIPKKAIVSDTADIEKKMGELLAKQKEKLERLAKEGKLKAAKGSAADRKGKPKPKGKGKEDDTKKKKSSKDGKRANPNHAHEKEKRQKITEAAKYAMTSGEGKDDEEDEDECQDILVIMDDVCSEDSIRYAKSMGTVAMNGRQYRISCIILSQMVAGSGSVPPRVRTQVPCHCGSGESTE